jgi:hypothetical protein
MISFHCDTLFIPTFQLFRLGLCVSQPDASLRWHPFADNKQWPCGGYSGERVRIEVRSIAYVIERRARPATVLHAPALAIHAIVKGDAGVIFLLDTICTLCLLISITFRLRVRLLR